MKRLVVMGGALAVSAVSLYAEMGSSCIDPATADKTNSVPCSVLKSDPGTVLLGRNPLPQTMAVDFESRYRVSTESNAASFDPLWSPGFLLLLH